MDDTVVLVVEDEESFRKLIRVLLQKMLGVRAVLVGDGKEALRQLEEVRPALVLLDLNVPETDGIEFIHKLRAHPASKASRVVALTALSEARQQAMEAGCDDFIEKPFDLDYFLSTVRKHLPARG